MKKEINGYVIEVDIDNDPESPREWNNLGTMICFHGRYSLGDKHDYREPYDFEKELKQIRKNGVVLPLYLYDHSGITMSTKPFSCRWDSGQVGYIYVTKETILKEFGGKILTKKLKENMIKHLICEVEVYDKYLRGEVYQFTIKKDNEIMDSCCGFYDEEECILEAEGIVNCY